MQQVRLEHIFDNDCCMSVRSLRHLEGTAQLTDVLKAGFIGLKGVIVSLEKGAAATGNFGVGS